MLVFGSKKPELYQIIGATSVAFSVLVLALNLFMIYVMKDIDINRFINVFLTLGTIFFFGFSLLPGLEPFKSLHIVGFIIGGSLCFSAQGSAMFGVVLFTLSFFVAYTYGYLSHQIKIKLIASTLLALAIITGMLPYQYGEAFLFALAYTSFSWIFIYILFAIMKDKIETEKRRERDLLDLLKETHDALDQTIDIVKKHKWQDGCK